MLTVEPGRILINSWRQDPHSNNATGAPEFLFIHVGLYEVPTRVHGKLYYVAAIENGRSKHWLSDEDAEQLKTRKDDPVRR